jgi:chemotaxis protein methyltransferase CheR
LAKREAACATAFTDVASLENGLTVTISDNDFCKLRDFIYAACGIFFHVNKKYFLENRIARRMTALQCLTPGDYIKLLGNGMNGKEELKRLLDEITTNETCFFRNPAQLKAFELHFLPEIIKIKENIGYRRLRIWSGGSSSGEEAYTFAMLLVENRMSLLKDWTLEIVGTDINERILAQAREGVYSPYSVRNVPEPYLRKYFTKSGEQFILKPEIKKYVTFSNLNLYEDSRMLFMKTFDIIICANVLIYFDASAKTKIVNHFYNNLQPYGYFFLGQSETLHGVNDKFKPIHFPGGFAYTK